MASRLPCEDGTKVVGHHGPGCGWPGCPHCGNRDRASRPSQVGELVELGDARAAREGAPVVEAVFGWWDRGDGTLVRVLEASEDVDLAWLADELVDIAGELRQDLDAEQLEDL